MGEIHHFGHKEHPLKLIENWETAAYVGDGDVKGVVDCDGCREHISGGSAYGCVPCGYFLHKTCAELMPTVNHHFHPLHPLTLSPRPHGWRCDVCFNQGFERGFSYKCSECDFDACLTCGAAISLKEGEIHHLGHTEHLLKLIENWETAAYVGDDDVKGVVDCDGCREHISGGSAYGCVACSYFLHKTCAEAELKPTMNHPFHPLHPLTLSPGYNSWNCNVCGKGRFNRGFSYNCFNCDFRVCIECVIVVIAQEIAAVALKKEASIKFKYEGHPQHTLTLQLRSASFRCDACNVKDEDLFYQCDDCDFWIHKGCTTLVRTISLTQHHHSLTLVYSLPDNFYRFSYYCDFCKKQVLQKDWLYHCANCRYFAHIKCALNAQHPSSLRDGPGTSSVDEDQVNDLLQFPMSHAFTDPLKLLHSQKITQDEDDETATEINHWSHDHPVILNNVDSDQGNNIDFGADADPVEVCYVCVRPLSFPYYSCNKDGCPFFLHKYCAELPLTLDKHQLHPDHPLHLVAVPSGDRWYCYGCYNKGNTFSYKCETCEFCLDVNCASLPNTIKHELHNHPLIQVIDPTPRCEACNNHRSCISYACKDCNFQLDMYCALRSPSSLGHRYCKGHEILLTYPPVEDHPEDFYCDICEEEMHPKRPLYYCKKCKNSFHLECLGGIDRFENLWKEGTRTESYHKHPLTFVRRKKSPEYVCCKCNVDMNGRLILECRSKGCNFNICYRCHYFS